MLRLRASTGKDGWEEEGGRERKERKAWRGVEGDERKRRDGNRKIGGEKGEGKEGKLPVVTLQAYHLTTLRESQVIPRPKLSLILWA